MNAERWERETPIKPAAEDDRAWLIAALMAAQHGIAAATLDDADQREDQVTWAMRLLESTESIERDIRWLRQRLCRIAADAGVSLREIALVAGVSHATVRAWTSRAREHEVPPRETLWHLNLSDEDDLGADALKTQMAQFRVDSDSAERVRSALRDRT